MGKAQESVIAFLCLLSLLVILCAGCSTKKTGLESVFSTNSDLHTSTNTELEVAVFEGGYGNAYWKSIIKEFEADHPGVKVTLTSNPQIGEILRPRFVSGDVPDFIYMNPADSSGLLPSAARDGALTDITDVFNSRALDTDKLLKDIILEGFLDSCKPNGDDKIYYAPAYYYTGGLFYNKTYFESKGLKPPKTWDEFLSLGEVARADGKALFAYQGIYPSYNEMIFFPAIASSGGEQIMNDIYNYKDGAFEAGDVKKVMGIFAAIAKKGYLAKGTVAMNHTQAQAEFINGKALFLPCGSWFETEMKDAIDAVGQSFSVGFAGTPVFKEGDQPYCFGGAEAFVIPQKAKHVEAAKEFLKYNYTIEAVKLNAENAKGVMPVNGAVELAKPFISAATYECYKLLDNGAKLCTENWKLIPKTEVKLSDEIFNPLNSLMLNKLTVDQWADRIEKATARIRESSEINK